MDCGIKSFIKEHEGGHGSRCSLSVSSRNIDYILICSCESTQKLCSVKYLEIEFCCSLNFFVLRKNCSCLDQIVRFEIVDVCSDLAVIDLDSLLFENGRSL